MELKEYIQIIKKRLWLVLIITLISTLASFFISKYAVKPEYQATATLIVGRTPINQNDRLGYDDILTYEKLMKTYSELARSRTVTTEAISRLNKYDITLGELMSGLSVTPQADTQILEVTSMSGNPERAADIANIISQVFIEKVRGLMNSDEVKILDMAIAPTFPAKPNIMMNTAIAFFLSLMVSLGIVFLIEYLDSTMKTDNDIERYLAITVLANIPYVKETKK